MQMVVITVVNSTCCSGWTFHRDVH